MARKPADTDCRSCSSLEVVVEVVIDKFDAAVAVVVEASEAARRPTD